MLRFCSGKCYVNVCHSVFFWSNRASFGAAALWPLPDLEISTTAAAGKGNSPDAASAEL